MLIKIDILSNNGLSQCIEINPEVEIDAFTFDDPKVYECLSSGDNLGITYAESRGMNKIFTLLKPKKLEDIADISSHSSSGSKKWSKSLIS